MHVATHHQVVALGDNLMQLRDRQTGQVIVSACRESDTWSISCQGADNMAATSRSEAITAMTEQALKVLDGTGFSALVPHGLREMP